MATEREFYEKMVQERDVMLVMRDGIKLAADIYRPDAPGKFPVIYSTGPHNKDLQRPEVAEALNSQPAYSSLWYGVIEAGDTKRFVSAGYAHVIAQQRGLAKSEGVPGVGCEWDHYDAIEWIAKQSWCDGNVGMAGISGFAGEQWLAAAQQPPALKAIFPYDACGAYGGPLGFREHHPGGVVQTMWYNLSLLYTGHENRGVPATLPPDMEELWEKAMANPDYMMYAHLYNILTQKGQRDFVFFNTLLNPYDSEESVKESEETFKRIKVPFYTGSGAYGYTYKCHWQGAQHWYSNLNSPKKMMFTGPAHLERPYHSYHDEILRWYDYWLKGIDTGIMDEPPIKVWVMGANQWRYASDWPLPETQWTKYYLHTWERLKPEPHLPAYQTYADPQPDAFVQMPPTQTLKIERLRYMTDPLPEDILVIGPISLTLYASIDQEDTNWIVTLKDVGPDVSVRTARQGERLVPENLPERELTRGWLKASHRAVDPQRSKPWAPWHPLTREAQKPVVPGEVAEYQIEILSTANLFEKGHRICLDISCLDLTEGVAGETSVEYIPHHVCSSKTTLHKIYHNAKYPSRLLLPIIPKGDSE